MRKDFVCFLIQSVSMISPKKILKTIYSLTAIEIFRIHPEVKRFCSEGILVIGFMSIQ